MISRRYRVRINNILKYIAFVVAVTFKYTQNLLCVKTTTLLKFIKIYNKRKIVFINNISVLFANIARSFQQLILIQHKNLNFRLRQANRFFYTLKKNISFELNFDDNNINVDAIDFFLKKKLMFKL